MSTCKDCLHYEVCQYHITEETDMTVNECSHGFKNKADYVEVKKGKWEEERWCDNFQHNCSLCHKTVRVHPRSVEYKYCPYCGARMKGGVMM